MECHWAVLRSQSHRERLAARAIGTRGVESYVPSLPCMEGLRHPLFPGYLFAHVVPDSDDLLRIRSAPGVAYVLPRVGVPQLLPDQLIETIRAHEKALNSQTHAGTFQRGDRVVVVSGPFKWVEGLFDRRVDAHGRVRILLSLVHGTLPVQLPTTALERATSPRGFSANPSPH